MVYYNKNHSRRKDTPEKHERELSLKKIRKGYGQIAMMKNLVTTTPYMKNDLEV
jgi:hypothetical protein